MPRPEVFVTQQEDDRAYADSQATNVGRGNNCPSQVSTSAALVTRFYHSYGDDYYELTPETGHALVNCYESPRQLSNISHAPVNFARIDPARIL